MKRFDPTKIEQSRDEARQEIAQLTEQFLARGGMIEQIPYDRSFERQYKKTFYKGPGNG